MSLVKQIPPPAPAITVQQTAVDFGTIDAGQTGEQTITIKNTGTGSLEITGIESDVSGLMFEPSMFTLEPNSSQHCDGDVSEFDGRRVFG